MWDYDGLMGKAQTYFERAEAVAADDDAFAIWLLLGLEFLLRAPLARVHPALLADPNGDAIMHATGFPAGPNAKDPKSIQLATVISRLRRVVVEFTPERESDATLLTGLRNRELHTSEAALAGVDASFWLPRFTRVAEVVCRHLGLDAANVVGREITEQGRALVDAEDRQLLREVTKLIEAAKASVGQLADVEIASRRDASITARADDALVVPCPACDIEVELDLEVIRTTNERFEDEEILRDVISVARGLHCEVCDLTLEGTKEIGAAGLSQQYTRTEVESVADRYLMGYEPDDYGND